MIEIVLAYLKANIIYSILVSLLLGWFAYNCYLGTNYFAGNNVQKNAGYSGPVPHSGYGVRFYHK